jgi:hypothetical protein
MDDEFLGADAVSMVEGQEQLGSGANVEWQCHL